MKEPQQVTTKNQKKNEAGKRVVAHNRRQREEEEWSESMLWHWGCASCGCNIWSWLLHLSDQERRTAGPHKQRR